MDERADRSEYQVHLRWTGPYSFTSLRTPSILASPETDLPGIYVWLVRTDAGLRIHYVGEAGISIARRHVEHFEAYATGRYSVRDADAFRSGREVLLSEGGYWRRQAPAAKQHFIDGFPRFASEISRVLELIDVYVAPLDRPQRLRRRVEGGLVNALYDSPSVQRELFQPGFRTWRRNNDEPMIDVFIESPPPIKGFPERLTV